MRTEGKGRSFGKQTENTPDHALARLSAQARWLDEKNYLRYLRAVWRSTEAFGWYSTALTVFRRIRLVRLFWRIFYALWVTLQTGTLLLLLLPVVLIFVPGVLLLSLLMLLGGALELRRLRRVMTARMKDKTVVFLHAEQSAFDVAQDRGGAFFRAQLRWLDSLEGTITVVRSPYLFGAKGFGGKGFYWSQRRESKRVYLARTLGFFSLRKIARHASKKVIFVV